MDTQMLQAIKELLKSELKEQLEPINNRLDSMENKMDLMQTQISENTQILKALKHSAEVNKAEHDKMINDIAHIKGDVNALKNDVEALKSDVNKVELITASNWTDIAKLKAVR
jgi:chromosome segregation ATPase